MDKKELVRKEYGRIAATGGSCCGAGCGSGSGLGGNLGSRLGSNSGGGSGCGMGGLGAEALLARGQGIGYALDDLRAAPQGADLGLGCGSPVDIAPMREGETVLDLGSGPGLDCILAARRVGPSGRVIGVDMTPEMLERARRNAEVAGLANVEFRQGEIERLPVEDASVDVLLSNCVINLSPDKPRVLAEAFRALRPGGRLMVSDMVLTADLPAPVLASAAAWVG